MTINSLVQILSSVLLFSLLFTMVMLVRNLPSSSRNRILRRMQSLTEHHNSYATTASGGELEEDSANWTLLQKLLHQARLLGDKIPLLDAKQRTDLGLQLTRAGFRDDKAVSILIGIKLMMGALQALLAALYASAVPYVNEHFAMRIVLMGAVFMIGVILPEAVLSRLIVRRQKSISTYFSDALDLMVICTNAGNSLPVSIRRVAREMHAMCPPLADEFSFTADQLQVDGDSASALRSMSERIGIKSMRGLVTTLIQSQQYGTPISQSLKTLARGERNAQMMHLEEQAAKLAPKLTVPMMLFILPTVVIVSVGPAILNLMTLFSN